MYVLYTCYIGEMDDKLTFQREKKKEKKEKRKEKKNTPFGSSYP